MVKDHQISLLVTTSLGRDQHVSRLWRRRSATRRPFHDNQAKNSCGLHSATSRPAFQFIVWFWAVVVFCSGCQSGLVDPRWSRGSVHPSRPNVIPAPPPFQPGGQPTIQPNVESTTSNVSATPGGSANVWRNVARQPAASVIKLSPEENSQAKYHTVGVGETWESLAEKYGLTVKQLADVNGIDPSVPLQQGQIIYTVHSEK